MFGPRWREWHGPRQASERQGGRGLAIRVIYSGGAIQVHGATWIRRLPKSEATFCSSPAGCQCILAVATCDHRRGGPRHKASQGKEACRNTQGKHHSAARVHGGTCCLRTCLSVRFQGLASPPEYWPSAPSRLWPAKRAALCLPDPCGLSSGSHGGKVFSGKLLKFLTQTGSDPKRDSARSARHQRER